MRLKTLALLLLAALPLAAQKRPITEKDLFDFTWIGDTQLAPDGHTAAFVQTTVTPDHAGYQTSLYLLDLTTPGARPQLLTAGTHDSAPRWNANGSQLAFLRPGEKDGKPTPPQLYVLDILPRLTTPRRISDLPKGVSSYQWNPNGATLAATSQTSIVPEKKPAKGDDHVSDIRIIDHAGFRSNGEGYLDPKLVPQLYEITVTAQNASLAPALLLTNRRFGVQDYAWANASWIVYTALPPNEPASDEPYYQPYSHNAIYAFAPPAPGTQQQQQTPPVVGVDPFPIVTIADKLPFDARGLSIAPTSSSSAFPTRLAFHAEAAPIPPAAPVSHQQSDLFVLDLAWPKGSPTASAAPRNLTAAQGFEMGSGVGGDNTAPRGAGRTAIAWSPDAQTLYDIAGSQGSALLVAVDATSGDLARLTARQQAVLTFAASRDSKTLIALISNPILIGDLFRIDPTGTPAGPHSGTAPAGPGNQTQLTDVNGVLFSQLDLTMPRELHVTPTVRPDDIPFLTIDTFVQLPPNFVEGKKYPAILNIHGGPHSAYGWVFDHEMLYMAAQGYVVDYPNPRGSTTYGEKFANVIESNYPGDDFHDLMDTVDAIVAKGWADPAKLGVTGGSGGGLLTDWTVTQTNRFKAAVAQRDIADQAAWWYTADFAPFHQYWMPEAPFDHVDLYKAHSPLTFVNNVKTPMMFILGDADYRTPPTSGGEELRAFHDRVAGASEQGLKVGITSYEGRQILALIGNRYVVFAPEAGPPLRLSFDPERIPSPDRVGDESDFPVSRLVDSLQIEGMRRVFLASPDDSRGDVAFADGAGGMVLVDVKVRESEPKRRDLDRAMVAIKAAGDQGQHLEVWFFNIERIGLKIMRLNGAPLEFQDFVPLHIWEKTEDGVFGRKRVVDEVENWQTRLAQLYADVTTWLGPRASLRVEQTRFVTMSEELMRKFAVSDRDLPILDILASRRVLASLVPRGLWLIGAWGRVDVITSGRTTILVAIKAGGAYTWRFAPSADRRDLQDLNREAFLELVGLR